MTWRTVVSEVLEKLALEMTILLNNEDKIKIAEALDRIAEITERLVIGNEEPTIPGFNNTADLGEIEPEAVRNQQRAEQREVISK